MMWNTIMHAHTFASKAELLKKDLLKKTQEATDHFYRLNQVEARRIKLLDKLNVARKIEKKDEATARASAKKAAKAQKELVEALATKDAEIKAIDEKVYAEGQDDACNQGYYPNWVIVLKKLYVPGNSSLRDLGQLDKKKKKKELTLLPLGPSL
ncbi:hypothetical protein CsSME_00051336 [Camellia sinensis var. sinensis]